MPGSIRHKPSSLTSRAHSRFRLNCYPAASTRLTLFSTSKPSGTVSEHEQTSYSTTARFTCSVPSDDAEIPVHDGSDGL